PKYFYDEAGSALFEEITRQPEYYLTRTEAAILEEWAPEIGELMGESVTLVELGSGSSRKTRILLKSLLHRREKLHYLPIDISSEILHETASELDARYPALQVTPIASPYETGLSKASRLVADEESPGGMLVLFLGSSIGNMEPEEAVTFLTRIRRSLGRKDALLVGFDRVKDERTLNAAYNDARGVTAAFNLNLLARINRELGGEFDLDRFSHLAFYDEDRERIEMHLVSEARQEVRVGALERSFALEPEERIHTENSYKYTPARIADFGLRSRLRIAELFSDEKDWFTLVLFVPA
ncbi:MAG: L-histidine N(alpha)-methyltransferase, partial [Vicinamibacteria bacterium]